MLGKEQFIISTIDEPKADSGGGPTPEATFQEQAPNDISALLEEFARFERGCRKRLKGISDAIQARISYTEDQLAKNLQDIFPRSSDGSSDSDVRSECNDNTVTDAILPEIGAALQNMEYLERTKELWNSIGELVVQLDQDDDTDSTDSDNSVPRSLDPTEDDSGRTTDTVQQKKPSTEEIMEDFLAHPEEFIEHIGRLIRTIQ